MNLYIKADNLKALPLCNENKRVEMKLIDISAVLK